MTRVDPQQRRQEIAEAVWRILETGGVEAASVRAVVAETGLSSGSIRFFFTNQAELHEFAMSALAARVAERIRRAAGEPDARDRAVAMVSEVMPLRDDTERELGVWMAFVMKGRHDPRLGDIVREQAEAVRDFLTGIISDLASLGLRPTPSDLPAEARRLNAVVDGLTFELLTAPTLVSREQAAALLRRELLGGEEHS